MTDAHCHPWDLLEYLKTAEEERRKTKTAVAASSWNLEQFEYHEGLSRKAGEDGAPRVFGCFALHPQLSGGEPRLSASAAGTGGGDFSPSSGLELLYSLAAQGRLDGVGETGFDLYNERFRAGEKIQDEMFVCHLEAAVKYSLPVVLHVRRAMHKIFPFSKELKKLPAVVFHSWPGTRAEGQAMLKRGINAYFSFGTVVCKNHREAMACAAGFPSDRILLETDAPYQPLRGKAFSSWRDLAAICGAVAELRKDAHSDCACAEEVEEAVTANFFRVFSK